MQLGAQLWLFSKTLDENAMNAILTQLSHAGYDCVETMYGKPPLHREALSARNLTCYATHVSLCAIPPGAQLPEFAHRLGAGVVCVSGLLRWNEREADDYRRAADALNVLGLRFRDEGLALHYHNHDFEFAPVEGATTGMDLLLSGLDPAVAPLCFDAGWAALAGHAPHPFLVAHASRIATLHLRDFRGAVSVPLGAGDVDQTAIVGAIPDLPNLRAVLVEQDPGTETPGEDMATSRRFLHRFGL